MMDPQGKGGSSGTLIMMGLMILVFWLFMIRPQAKKAKKQKDITKTTKIHSLTYNLRAIVLDAKYVLKFERRRIQASTSAASIRSSSQGMRSRWRGSTGVW